MNLVFGNNKEKKTFGTGQELEGDRGASPGAGSLGVCAEAKPTVFRSGSGVQPHLLLLSWWGVHVSSDLEQTSPLRRLQL